MQLAYVTKWCLKPEVHTPLDNSVFQLLSSRPTAMDAVNIVKRVETQGYIIALHQLDLLFWETVNIQQYFDNIYSEIWILKPEPFLSGHIQLFRGPYKLSWQ